MSRWLTGVLATALALLVTQGCAIGPVTDGVPRRFVDGLHAGSRHPAPPFGAPRGEVSEWAFGIGEQGIPDGAGPEADPDEPRASVTPLYW